MAVHVMVPHRRRGRAKRRPGVALFLLSLIAIGGVVIGVRGCNTVTTPQGMEMVTISGERFFLEPALEEPKRIRGLGGVEAIDANGGMLFVFPEAAPRQFVMRDCLTAIDIAYLDDLGRIVRMHEMSTEPPQRADETASQYEMRLKRYTSDFPVRFVVEVAPGTWRRLGVKPGDRIELDADGLKARAR